MAKKPVKPISAESLADLDELYARFVESGKDILNDVDLAVHCNLQAKMKSALLEHWPSIRAAASPSGDSEHG